MKSLWPPKPPSAPVNASTNPMPRLDVPLVDKGGFIDGLWARWLGVLWGKAGGAAAGLPVPETVGPSPYAYAATEAGTAVISGGTVSAMTLTRNGTSATLPTAGTIPMRTGDILTVTYTAAPTFTWFPL